MITKRVGNPARPRSQGSRRAAPDAYTFADDACGLSPLRLRRPPSYWSRPMHIDVCSMFARMPRYAPAVSGIRGESRISATGQNGSSRHGLALLDSSSRRINERRSGLLIRGFGVQVPGGAPVLTWGFIAPGRFFCVRFVSMAAPWLLACTDPAIRGLSKTAQSGADAACGCRKCCHPMRPAHIRGSGRRTGPGAEPGRSRPERVDADARQARPGAAPGAACARCNDRRTHQGPAAGAVPR
jgi:hypothetical protein